MLTNCLSTLKRPIIFYLSLPGRNVQPNSHGYPLEGTQITQVVSIKFLGVYIDQHLSWKEHIKNISIKIAKNIGILSRISLLVPPSIRKILYYTLVYPYLTYCNIIWSSTYKSNLTRLVVLRKRAVRYVVRVPYGAHTKSIFTEFQFLRLVQIRLVQIGEFMFRYEHGLLPPTFNNFFLPSFTIHSHQTRGSNLYYKPFAHTNTRLFSIRYTGAQTWNDIPLVIKQLPNFASFKKGFAILLLVIMY